ncbi:hypothetical protein ES703_122154 [subsurface metagenome]
MTPEKGSGSLKQQENLLFHPASLLLPGHGNGVSLAVYRLGSPPHRERLDPDREKERIPDSGYQ